MPEPTGELTMRGRKPKLNWTESRGCFTATIAGHLHFLGTDEEKAKRQFAFLLSQNGEGIETDTNALFWHVAEYYLAHVEREHSAGRYRLVKATLESFSTSLGEHFRVKDIKPAHMETWLHGQDYTAGTTRQYMAIVLACLNWSATPRNKKGGELIAENPLKGRLRLPTGESRGKETVWTKETFESVLKIANPAFADMVRIIAWTGCRPSVATTVEAKDYNKKFSRWDVAKKVGRKVTPNIRLSGAAVELVERKNAAHPTGPVFLNSAGTPWTAGTLGSYLRYDVMPKLDPCPEGLCVYGLRHTFASNFLSQNPNGVETLRRLLGHSDYKMILKNYSHLCDMDDHMTKTMENFDPFA